MDWFTVQHCLPLARIQDLAIPADVETPVAAGAATPFAPEEAQADAFQDFLALLCRQVWDWETAAGPGEVLTAERHWTFWQVAVHQCKACNDAWDRPPDPGRMPEALLALTDPRLLVRDATHLPEDVEPWIASARRRAGSTP